MTILFGYILREYAKIFLMCFAGLITIYMVIDFFEKVRRFLRYDSGVLPILAYFALKIPAISFQVVPFAVLVATLLTLGLLAQTIPPKMAIQAQVVMPSMQWPLLSV